MRWMRRFGLCLMVVLAAGMVVAASANASAEVRFQTCEKAPKFNGHDTGKYTEGNCATVSETSEGAYERNPVDEGASLELKGKSGPSIFYIYSLEKEELLGHSAGLVWKLECAKDKSSGEVTGPQLGWLKVTFSKCTVTREPGGVPEKCKGKVETSKLATEIEVFNSTKGEEPPHEGTPYFGGEMFVGGEYPASVAQFECGATKFELTGGLGDPEMSEPLVNACSKTVTLSFKVGGFAPGERPEEPEAYGEDWGSLHGRPYTVVNGVVYGTGLQGSETLKSKTSLCFGYGFPQG